MKVSKLLLAAALPILNAACASFPGVSIVDPPSERVAAPSLPPPIACLTPAAEPTISQPPQLPDLLPPPVGAPQNTAAWQRLAALHFESRARRAELAQAYAANAADAEREVRISNAITHRACMEELQQRDDGEAPVG